MARRRTSRVRTVYRKAKSRGRRRYSERKNYELKKYGNKLLKGTLAGLALSVPVTLAASYLNKPELVEIANRGGAVTASMFGGPVGVVGYQVADAAMDRFVKVPSMGGNISGGSQVYL